MSRSSMTSILAFSLLLGSTQTLLGGSTSGSSSGEPDSKPAMVRSASGSSGHDASRGTQVGEGRKRSGAIRIAVEARRPDSPPRHEVVAEEEEAAGVESDSAETELAVEAVAQRATQVQETVSKRGWLEIWWLLSQERKKELEALWKMLV